ncbi:MAG: hypothetical protein L6R28_13315 [Planctomycetes bacterium]|nr:hypothetical protein [Planctomycetota bacterium]
MIDHDALRRIAHELYVPVIHANHGDEGTRALRVVLEFLGRLFERIEPELLNAPLIVLHPISGFDEASLPVNPNHAQDIPSLAPLVRGPCVIRIRDRGFECWSDKAIDLSIVSKKAVVYCFDRGAERFVVDGTDHHVPAVDTTQASVFARPTFGSLREALQRYRHRVRASSCLLFNATWEDGNRLFFRSGAEEDMRRSMHQYLATVLRDAEVRPEQNVDETHPIDIKVTWMFTTRLALIEIKWLGKSRDAGRITATHGDSRAKSGANQLANYLDANRIQAPEHITRGYLVVIDGRRRGLNAESTTITRADGLHYDGVEIAFNPEYHKARDDFDEPIRLFCEPICTAT